MKAFAIELILLHFALTPIFLGIADGFPVNKRVSNAPGWDPRSTPFPNVRREDVVFQYRSEATKGNVSISDPYNWLEKSDVNEFTKSQLSFTKSYLDKLEDLQEMRNAILKSFFTILRPPVAIGTKEDPTYTFYGNQSGDGLGYLYIVDQKQLDQADQSHSNTLPGKVLIDESLLQGRLLWDQKLSPDGTKTLYTTVDAKTYENGRCYVRDTSSPLIDKSQPAQEGGYGRHPDIISDSKLGTETWSGDSKGFFYTAKDSSIKYHLLGTDAKDDVVLVKPNKDERGDWWLQLSDDLKYVVLYGSSGKHSGSSVYVASLDQPISSSMKWLCISPDYSSSWDYATNLGIEFYFRTNQNAPNSQIIRFSLDFTKAVKSDDLKNFTTGEKSSVLIPPRSDAKIDHFITYDSDKILIVYGKNNMPEFIALSLKTGKDLQRLDLGKLSTSIQLSALASSKDVYVKVSSLNSPGELFHLKWNQESSEFTSKSILKQKSDFINPDNFVLEQKWAPSKTGDVQVPFLVLYRKGLKLDGSHPLIINFYGAYSVSLDPYYDSHHMAFVRSYDAIYILASPRGGGELGEDWHKDGQLDKKQHTIDDVMGITQFAVDQKWTSPGKVILNVQSAGASASAAIINQAPEGLFGAFIGTRGMYDLVRSDQSTDKSSRAAEYGSPSDAKAFDWLRKWSPLHNIDAKKAYPTVLIYPPIDDTAAEPWHSFKYISELQHDLPNNPNPILMGNGTDTQEERSATAFALVAHTLGLKRVD